MAGRRVRMLALLPLWRYRTTGKQSRLAATGVYAPSLRSPWRAAFATALLTLLEAAGESLGYDRLLRAHSTIPG